MLPDINGHKLDDLSKLEFEQLIKTNKDDLLNTFKKSRNDLILMSDEVKKVIHHAETNNWKEIKDIWTVIGFIILASLDFKIYNELILNTDENIHRINIIRMVYTQIYEALDDLNKLTNINFVNSIKAIGCNDLVPELFEKRKMLNNFKKKYENDLYNIRTTVGAHREHNYIEFHNMLINLDYSAAISIVIKFDNILNEFGSVMKKIMDYSVVYAEKNYGKNIIN
jgi:hypothetical protein